LQVMIAGALRLQSTVASGALHVTMITMPRDDALPAR
jgi:hypothetical protein